MKTVCKSDVNTSAIELKRLSLQFHIFEEYVRDKSGECQKCQVLSMRLKSKITAFWNVSGSWTVVLLLSLSRAVSLPRCFLLQSASACEIIFLVSTVTTFITHFLRCLYLNEKNTVTLAMFLFVCFEENLQYKEHWKRENRREVECACLTSHNKISH